MIVKSCHNLYVRLNKPGQSLLSRCFHPHSLSSLDHFTYRTSEHLICVCLFVAGGEDCFEVDRNLGDVRTTGRPLSPGKEYTLTVQAVDTQGRKGPHASVAIMVGLRPPQFFNNSYSIYIPESTGVGHA